MKHLTVAAVDLGAESGRVASAQFNGTRLDLSVVHRFANIPTESNGWRRWDTDSLWAEVSAGLATMGEQGPVASVGVDTWGIDYGLYDSSTTLISQPTTYRDAHRISALKRALNELGAERIYSATGIQLLEINSLFGLMAEQFEHPELLKQAQLMLMMPDVFHNRLSGSRVTESSVASTTGAFDVGQRRWAIDLLDALNVPTHFLPEVVPAGTDVGPIIGELGARGLSKTRVILPSTHDTSSAVLAIPHAKSDTLFISSGTWSLVGVVLPEPIISRQSRLSNLTNDGGYEDSVHFLRIIMGLWMLQECRKQWQKEGRDLTYAELVRLAEAETPLDTVINVNAIEFLAPGDMPTRIREHCKANGMTVPETVGQMARTVIDSLAVSYRLTLEDIQALTGVPITSIAVVGGGGDNSLLQSATASATRLPVVCWAKEATALGNAAVQLRALGEVDSVEQIWGVIAASTETRTYYPRDSDRWAAAATRLRELERLELLDRGLGEFVQEPN
jgi:rhamnulokinase